MFPIIQHFDAEQTLRAWQRFMQMGELMPCIPAPIARSWFRCKNRGQLSLQLLPSNLPISGVENREQNLLLRQAFQHTFKDLSNYLGLDELLLAVADREGTLLDWQGHQEFLMSGALQQGQSLSEETLGTMAISLALREREAIFVRGAQHYYSCYHQLASFATPLVSGENFLGILGGWTAIHASSLAVASVCLGRKVLETVFSST